jgi:hypothetical protein
MDKKLRVEDIYLDLFQDRPLLNRDPEKYKGDFTLSYDDHFKGAPSVKKVLTIEKSEIYACKITSKAGREGISLVEVRAGFLIIEGIYPIDDDGTVLHRETSKRLFPIDEEDENGILELLDRIADVINPAKLEFFKEPGDE